MDTANAYLAMLSEGDDRTTASKRMIAAGGAEALHLATVWGRASDSDRRGAALDPLLALRDSAFDSEVDPDPEITRVLFEQAGTVTAEDEEYLRWRAARALALVGMGGAPAVRYEAVESLMRFADDEDDDVRHQVAYGLSLMTPEDAAPEDPSVVVLVRLLGDPDPDVLDCAPFAFTIRTVDSPAIRDALVVLSATSVEPAAGQTGIAHADRGDARFLPVALQQLGRDEVTENWVWRVASILANPVLLPTLQRLCDTGWPEREHLPHLRDRRRAMLDEAIVTAQAPNGTGEAPERGDPLPLQCIIH